MATPLLPEALWQRIEPLLPPVKRRRFRFPGRKPLTHRQALTGILFVLRTGINWNDLPCELGCGSGSACRKRLQLWQQQGVWDRLHHLFLEELQEADKIDWSRAAVDSSFARALGGGEDTGPNTTPSSTRKASRCPRKSRPPTCRMSRNCWRSWMPSNRWRGRSATPSNGPKRCTRIGRTTATRTAKSCASAPSTRRWRDETRNTGAGWEYSVGWWSGSSVGCIGTGSCGCAPIGTRPTTTAY